MTRRWNARSAYHDNHVTATPIIAIPKANNRMLMNDIPVIKVMKNPNTVMTEQSIKTSPTIHIVNKVA